MQVQPTHNHVLVKPDEPETMSRGGILIPDSAKPKPVLGTVLAIGPGRYTTNGVLIPMAVRVGDRVLYGKYAGNECKQLNNNILMRDEDILCTVTEEDDA